VFFGGSRKEEYGESTEDGVGEDACNPAYGVVTPEAVPENSSITDFITVVVSGATVKDMPSPKMRMPGKKVVQ